MSIDLIITAAEDEMVLSVPIADAEPWVGHAEWTTPDGEGSDSKWNVMVRTRPGGAVTRTIRRDGKKFPKDGTGWAPEKIIWPTRPALFAGDDPPETALSGTREHWISLGERLRDSAKWMSTILGAALALILGTAPLSQLAKRPIGGIHLIFGGAGMVLLSVTLLLLLLVLRPSAVSFADVQQSGSGRWFWSLSQWKFVIESQPDLYLPCGIRCLASLRQAMIIEEVTLKALINAIPETAAVPRPKPVREAIEGRIDRLRELKHAAVEIATIGEFYRLRRRSSVASYAGVTCAALGTFCLVAALGMVHV